MEEGADGLHAPDGADDSQDHGGQADNADGDAEDEFRGLHHVGDDVLTAAFGGVHGGAAGLAEKTQGQSHDNQAQAAQEVHHEAEHVVGDGQVVKIHDGAGAGGGEARDAVEEGVQVRGVVAAVEQRDAGEEGQHHPGQARDGQGLLAVQARGADTQEAQQRSHNQADGDGGEVPGGGLPLAQAHTHQEGNHVDERGEQHQHTQVVADGANVREGESLPHDRPLAHDEPDYGDDCPARHQQAEHGKQDDADALHRQDDVLLGVPSPYAHDGYYTASTSAGESGAE